MHIEKVAVHGAIHRNYEIFICQSTQSAAVPAAVGEGYASSKLSIMIMSVDQENARAGRARRRGQMMPTG